MSYELLENDLTHSTLWMLCSKDAKLLFVTILAECRGHDVVRTPLPVLYRLAGLTAEEGTSALSELTRPDPASKFRGEEGRRIVPVEDEEGRGLWLPSYKSRRNRYLTRERKAAQRDRQRGEPVTVGHAESRSVTVRHAESRSVTQGHEKFASESESESEAESDKTPLTPRKRGARVPRDRARAEKDLPREREIRKLFVGANDPAKADEAVSRELGYIPSHRLHDDDEGGPF